MHTMRIISMAQDMHRMPIISYECDALYLLPLHLCLLPLHLCIASTPLDNVVAQDMHNMNGRVNKLTHLVEIKDVPKAPYAVDMVCVCGVCVMVCVCEGSRETEGDSCLCMCVCVCICMYVCTFVCMFVCVYICMYICMCVHLSLYLN